MSPDNRWVVTGSSDSAVRIWDLSAKDPAANPVVLRGHDGYVNVVAISPDNRLLSPEAETFPDLPGPED
jgi:WD40 repeat protein